MVKCVCVCVCVRACMCVNYVGCPGLVAEYVNVAHLGSRSCMVGLLCGCGLCLYVWAFG